MKNYYSKITIQVLLLFIVAIFATFIPDNFHDFFGDEICLLGNNYTMPEPKCHYAGCYNHAIGAVHWGVRHWLWFAMSLSIFIIQVIRITETKKN